jgi:hypothetical protein
MLWPGEQIVRRITRQGRRDRILLRLHQAGQHDVYAGLLHYAQTKGWKRGWAYYSFLEIFGNEPDRDIEPEALLDDLLIEGWRAECKCKPPAKRRSA